MSSVKLPVLVTGGAGYIGSHTVVELMQAGFDVVIIDNFCNSSKLAVGRLEKIVGRAIPVHEVDLLDKPALNAVFAKTAFSAVIHFAALKAVGESVSQPLRYYQNNVTGTLNLLEAMETHGVRRIVFSSSCTVYGDPASLPITEAFPIGNCTNPYGKSKYIVEEMLRDLAFANKEWDVMALRYFNPIGAHESGLIGEDPKGIPNCLLPFVAQVAVGRRPELSVFGDSYNTPDGTGVRDYIHVVDLARGHVAAVRCVLNDSERCGHRVYNLGSGNGYSVLEVVHAFEKASGRKVAYKICPPRPGDIAACYADASKALKELHWKTEKTLDQMCEDAWRWQSANPNGFE